MTKETNKPIVVLFDGVCNLCSGSVQFIIRHDRMGKFRFASLQSEVGQELMKRYNLGSGALHSILVIKNNVLYERSDAALQIAAHLDGFWSFLRIFKIIPRIVRDGIYNWIARNRYSFFGKKDACMIPTPELKERFL